MTRTSNRDYGMAPAGFRLPDGTHVGAVQLQVADLERSLNYYQQVLGLRVIEQAGGSAALGPHQDERILLRLAERAGARPARGEFGLYHFASCCRTAPRSGAS